MMQLTVADKASSIWCKCWHHTVKNCSQMCICYLYSLNLIC